MPDLALRAQLTRHDLQALADANALQALAGHRRQALWQALVGAPEQGLLQRAAPREETRDIASAVGSGRHRRRLPRARPDAGPPSAGAAAAGAAGQKRFLPAAILNTFANGQVARGCGIVTVRQRPQTAKGVMFVTMEDETGAVNVIVWPALVERQRKELLGASLLGVYGIWQCESNVRHLVAKRLVDLSPWLGKLQISSRDFA